MVFLSTVLTLSFELLDAQRRFFFKTICLFCRKIMTTLRMTKPKSSKFAVSRQWSKILAASVFPFGPPGSGVQRRSTRSIRLLSKNGPWSSHTLWKVLEGECSSCLGCLWTGGYLRERFYFKKCLRRLFLVTVSEA